MTRLAETSENNKKEELVTRYYRNDYDACKSAIKKIATEKGYTFGGVNDEFCEILIDSKDFTIIVKIVSITPIETSVDFYVTSESIFKNPTTHVTQWYDELKNKLNYIGKGLHKDG